MKKRLSGLVLATEIAAIVMLHSIKISHLEKTDKSPRRNGITQQAHISLGRSYSFSNLR